jgi:electron transfer flavoprotein beta subunit
MKVLVCVKHVVDPSIRTRVRSDGLGVETANVKMSMNPFDEVAVEQAVRLKEAGLAAEVIVLTVGMPAARDTLRTGLAMGADRAILVETSSDLEPLAVAKVAAAIVRREKPGILLLGKQAIDSDCAQTGPMAAALLGWPQATFAASVEIDGEELHVTRETDTGSEVVACRLPAVVTAGLRLCEPRYASLPHVMKAKKKPIEVVALETLEVDTAPRLRIVSVATSEQRRQTTIVRTVDELLARLRDEAKVLSRT